MELPTGHIVHLTDSRMRIRFDDKQNDETFFKVIEQALEKLDLIQTLRSTPMTASLLLEGDFSDVGKLRAYAESQNFFLLQLASAEGVPLRNKVYQSFDST